MEWYHLTLVSAAIVAIVLAWSVPRAGKWILLGVASYVVSAGWHNAGLPNGVWVGAASNFVIIVLITRYGRDRWEWALGHAFALMILLELMFAAGYATHLQLAVGLEIVNLAALLMIGATGAVQRIRNGQLAARIADCVAVRRSHHAAFAPAKAYPRWWWER